MPLLYSQRKSSLSVHIFLRTAPLPHIYSSSFPLPVFPLLFFPFTYLLPLPVHCLLDSLLSET